MEKIVNEQGDIYKYIFSTDDVIMEAVFVNQKSISISCSVMSGCPMGCRMCGAGKNFLRNLTADEIVQQVDEILKDQDLLLTINKMKSFQISFSNMGEPLLNWDAVETAIRRLHTKYPTAQLIISTIGPNIEKPYEKLLKLSKDIPQVNLQFTLHKASDIERDWSIPNKKVLYLSQIRDIGILWNRVTLRLVQLNYTVDANNSNSADLSMLRNLFSPVVFSFAFHFIYPTDRIKEPAFTDEEQMQQIRESFDFTYHISFVNDLCEQQSTIGAVPGQAWETQEWMKQHLEKE
ncbi:MAG: radical SAM protein [Prevotella sp.]|nr:radical SAM protein [Prevotella sp.]